MKSRAAPRRGLYVSTAPSTVALLKQQDNEKVGIYTSHVGPTISTRPRKRSWTPAAPISTAVPAPATPGAPPTRTPITEANTRIRSASLFDLTHTGWIGAVKDVVAAKN